MTPRPRTAISPELVKGKVILLYALPLVICEAAKILAERTPSLVQGMAFIPSVYSLAVDGF